MVARFIFCGGGTGGHLFPGIAIAQAIRKKAPDSAILFVGTRRGLEERILPTYGFDFTPIQSAGFKNLGLIKKLKALFILPGGVIEGLRLLRSFNPHVVIGLGSYSALPVMIAGILKRTKRVLQEQNSLPGLTNRILAPFAHKIFISFENTQRWFPKAKTLLTGNPIREEICRKRQTPSSRESFHLLVLGGSLGAHAINELCVATLPSLLASHPSLHIHIQTGKNDYAMVKQAFEKFSERVVVSDFIEDMASVYKWAHLVISRAGAITLSEIAACGLPAILIPYPHAANDHQTENARAFVSKGGAVMFLQTQLQKGVFINVLEEFLRNPRKLQEMADRMKSLGRPKAAETIAESLLALANPRGGETW